MAEINLNKVINVSVSQPTPSLGEFKTSNVLLITHETANTSFGTAGYKLYRRAADVVTDFGAMTTTAGMAASLFNQRPNILNADGYLAIVTLIASETVAAAITRSKDGIGIPFFGAMSTQIQDLASSRLINTALENNKIAAVVSRNTDDLLDPSVGTKGWFATVRDEELTSIRCLYYQGPDDATILNMMAAYLGRGLSVNYNQPLSTQTMHLKTLRGISPDASITTVNINLATQVGADIYSSVQGIPVVFTSGANEFFDNVQNLSWLSESIRVAGFNHLSTTNSKIAQTETGMDGYKSSIKNVLEKSVLNGFIASGTWTSSETFGSQENFLRAIDESGYYIYSTPISLQDAGERELRQAPQIQIAVKYAGAIHSSDIIIHVNQ